mmetsp:Transcript_19119/g.44548  ORF Transcript_19119/g.44548 Transcript_19119/m.44548 type:complete len:115 (+) Transcript_19119:54-398(+)|eukprot:CAMPEP_0116847578 /NCGR_PEP_ID=MMETSP0418-20121206/14513_1 /TAXON_ID=1158023 /ORGANISM="Astrosyne radiata, Strain 13vi08-1A" /LENGTH=114 /DNA_ID=CAMNT_0004479041 /DNA_START=55 /DNA_END=399 /DNA_ORIENTATION=-
MTQTRMAVNEKFSKFIGNMRCALNRNRKRRLVVTEQEAQQQQREEHPATHGRLDAATRVQLRADFYNGNLVVKTRGGNGPWTKRLESSSSEFWSSELYYSTESYESSCTQSWCY